MPPGSAVVMRTWPRLVGLQVADASGEGRESVQRLAELVERERLHVDTRGWRVARAGSVRVNAPSCDGAMVSGPLPRTASTRAHRRLAEQRLAARSACAMPVDLVDQRGSADGPAGSRRRRAGAGRTAMPCSPQSAAGPTPRAAGSAASRSRRPRGSPRRRRDGATLRAPSRARNATPWRGWPSSSMPLDLRAGPRPAGSARRSAGRRNALVALQRTPRFWFTWK